MGLFIYFDQQNQLVVYINALFPGFGKSVDEDIALTKDGLEIGKRIDAENKKYFKIPFGENVPITPDEYEKFNFYIMDDGTAYMKKFYPELYNRKINENHENGCGSK